MEAPKIKLAGVRTPLKKASAADFVAGSIALFTATLATLEAAPFKTVGAFENTLDTTARRTDGGVCTKAVVAAYAALMLQSFSDQINESLCGQRAGSYVEAKAASGKIR